MTSVRENVRSLFTQYRLLLALKTSIGVIAAWLLGVLLPGELDTYAYYAPLGALLGVTPTVFGSIRTSIELVCGIFLGVLVGWGLIAVGVPWFVRAPLAAGIGVLLAGIRMLGEGRVYVAIAGVFVAILGVDDPESYGLGYIAQFGLGLVVGTVVNLVFIPPLQFTSARTRISELRHDIANHIEDLAGVLTATWPPDHRDWLNYARDLRGAVDETQKLVDEARESSRANPRTLWHNVDIKSDYDDVDALRQVGLRLSDITDVLSGAIWNEPVTVELPSDLLDPLQDALTAVADFIRAWDTGENVAEARERCRDAVRVVEEAFENAEAAESGLGTVVFALKTVLKRIGDRAGAAE